MNPMIDAATIARPSAIDRFIVFFLWLFVKLFSTWVPTAAAIRNLAQLFGAVSCLPMAPALPGMRAGTSIRPLFWAALGRAAARQYLCICGTESKAQWCSENLLRN